MFSLVSIGNTQSHCGVSPLFLTLSRPRLDAGGATAAYLALSWPHRGLEDRLCDEVPEVVREVKLGHGGGVDVKGPAGSSQKNGTHHQ